MRTYEFGPLNLDGTRPVSWTVDGRRVGLIIPDSELLTRPQQLPAINGLGFDVLPPMIVYVQDPAKVLDYVRRAADDFERKHYGSPN